MNNAVFPAVSRTARQMQDGRVPRVSAGSSTGAWQRNGLGKGRPPQRRIAPEVRPPDSLLFTLVGPVDSFQFARHRSIVGPDH